MSAIICPLVFIDTSRSNRSRAPSTSGFGWYTVGWETTGDWFAEHSLKGLIGRYHSRAEAVIACGAMDIDQSRKWLREHP